MNKQDKQHKQHKQHKQNKQNKNHFIKKRNCFVSFFCFLIYKMQLLIEIIMGLLCGLFLGITSINPTGLVLMGLDLLGIGHYKTNIGSILFLNLFPITIGSVYEFYKVNKINYTLAFTLIITVMIGSYFGSKLVLGKNQLSEKTIKYITAYLSFFMGAVFLYSAYYEKK